MVSEFFPNHINALFIWLGKSIAVDKQIMLSVPTVATNMDRCHGVKRDCFISTIMSQKEAVRMYITVNIKLIRAIIFIGN